MIVDYSCKIIRDSRRCRRYGRHDNEIAPLSLFKAMCLLQLLQPGLSLLKKNNCHAGHSAGIFPTPKKVSIIGYGGSDNLLLVNDIRSLLQGHTYSRHDNAFARSSVILEDAGAMAGIAPGFIATEPR